MKKSYNPFKMWGTWLGLLLAIVIIQFDIFGSPGFYSVGGIYSPINYPITILSYLRTASLGFLLGWGIHSLFRRFN